MTLIKELLNEAEFRCPHLSYDGEKCTCKAVKNEMVCCHFSLQLWCLDKERFKNCLFFPLQIIKTEVK